MSRIIPFLLVAVGFASCTAARDEHSHTAAANAKPMPHAIIVDCPVYDGMTKTSAVLAQSSTGTVVQVTDTINAYFVKVRLDQSGKPAIGYMDRRCFGAPGNK